jgi:hypothetical protein
LGAQPNLWIGRLIGLVTVRHAPLRSDINGMIDLIDNVARQGC